MDDHHNLSSFQNRRKRKPKDVAKDNDPVMDHWDNEPKIEKKEPKKKKKTDEINPPLSTRMDLSTPEPFPVGVKYTAPPPRQLKEISKAKRLEQEKARKFCKFTLTQVPGLVKATKMNFKLKAPSAEIKEAKVMPRKASMSQSILYPEPPKRKELQKRKPKSGTFINVPKSEKPVEKKKKSSKTIQELVNAELTPIQEIGEGEDNLDETYLTKTFKKKVSQLSKTTSFNAEDLTMLQELLSTAEGEGEEDETVEEEEDHLINALVQKFRRDSEIKRYEPPKKKPKKGTLENFSFTKLKQPTLKSFYYGIKMATIHQGDKNFPVTSRDRQGMCMPIAAYCFSILKHPDKWNQGDLDDILEAGNELFLECAGNQHMHGDNIVLKTQDLQKYCKLGLRKVRFVVSEPEVSGYVRSEDKKVYNLTKAINVFFGRYSAGILQTDNLSAAIWKDKHYYFFDATPRTLDLYSNPNGTALLAHFYDTTSIISVLLDRSNLDNTPFVIYSIKAYKILKRDAEEVPSKEIIQEADNYQVLNEEKAVAIGSFDLADKCFGFSRNKQALTIAIVALVYSKITPPNSWHRGTVDKITIIGNQLFLECIENDEIEEVNLDDLPAIFTIGPYVVEIYISSDRFVDFMFKKSKCVLQDRLEKFFITNSNAVVQIDKCTIAIWKQRNIYHCFDPYSRNNEGFKCKNGSACISMHTTLSSLIQTVSTNFEEKDLIFHVHALKVCKIHRDPNRNDIFPRNLTMNEFPIECFKKFKMKKGKKKATAKKVTVDPSTRATIGDIGNESIMEVDSNVKSIGMEEIPSMVHKKQSKIALLLNKAPEQQDIVADLDSPSLSDTQIEEPPLEQPEEDVIEFVDFDAYALTQEELEMSGRGEGAEGGEGKSSPAEGDEQGEKEEVEKVEKEMLEMANDDEGEQWYMAMANFTQVGSHSLMSKLSAEMNTEYPVIQIPEEEVRTVVRDIETIVKKKKESEGEKYDCQMTEVDEVTMWQEYMKETNFRNLPDDSQIILGTKNMAEFGEDLEIMAPFVCIMATTVAQKYSIDSWSTDIVDYVLKCGSQLYHNSNTRFDQNYKLEIAKISLGSTDFTVKVDYVFDTYIKSKILSMALRKMLFPKSPMGIMVTPTYSCALFCKNHLYYLYDGFGNNEVGLSKGLNNEGFACFSRFTNVNQLVARILHNKTKREKEENVEFNRFVLSSCFVKLLPKEDVEPSDEDDLDKGEGEEQHFEVQTYRKKKEEEPEVKKPNKMGYQEVDGGLFKIQGTKISGGGKEASVNLKEDYFVCVCALLLLLNNPLKKWDEKKIDYALDEGMHIFRHAEDIDVCSKKFIKNVIIDDYIFDIITNRIVFSTFQSRRTLKVGIETMFQRKMQHFIIQFPNRCYTLSFEAETSYYHLFDPNDKSGKASWTRYKNFNKLIKRIKSGMARGSESYNFHSLEIMSISNAPKQVLLANRAKKYKIIKDKKPEPPTKPFHEECSWLNVEIYPWSWKKDKSQLPKWNNWYVDFPDDLYSLFGVLSPLDKVFPEETRGKQTLGNLVVAIGMTQIYDLCDWNEAILDSILLSGNVFFQECIKEITDENHEVAFEEIKKECKIFPYSFKVKFTPVVEGTMFLIRLKQFNLYKSLRLFFDDFERRYGVICVSKYENDKRLYAFGKVQEGEYFMYDCDTLGPPMYVEKDLGVPYVLRATSLNRLLHVMTLTMRGGDFFIFDVGLSEFKTIT